jgi:hypothetical protein
MYRPSKPSARSTNATIASECARTHEKEANASAPCNDDRRRKVAGYGTKNIPDKAREMAARRFMTKKNIVKCCWKRQNQYWDILVLEGRSTDTARKIGSGGMSSYRNVEKT